MGADLEYVLPTPIDRMSTRIVVFIILIATWGTDAVADIMIIKECKGNYSGKYIDDKLLTKVLNQHKNWVTEHAPHFDSERAKNDLRRANLCGADLRRPVTIDGKKIILSIGEQHRTVGKDHVLISLPAEGIPASLLKRERIADKFLGPQRIYISHNLLKGADLRGAKMESVALTGMTLDKTNLSASNVSRANFSGALLIHTNFSDALMMGTTFAKASVEKGIFSGAEFTGADLQNANFSESNFSSAIMWGTNLEGADLSDADLRNALLVGVNLKHAVFRNTNLSGAVFEPQPQALPQVEDIAEAKNISEMQYLHSPRGLIELRESFRRAGMRTQERQITYAIKHTELLLPWRKIISDVEKKDSLERQYGMMEALESISAFVLFDFTTRWGMTPGRALRQGAVLLVVCWIIYFGILLSGNTQHAIWRVWSDEPGYRNGRRKRQEMLRPNVSSSLMIGLQFSLLSMFHIRWRELDFGSWISRMQTREYVYRPTGLVRTVSGLQSMVSVYLVAIWALTYFGRPFD